VHHHCFLTKFALSWHFEIQREITIDLAKNVLAYTTMQCNTILQVQNNRIMQNIDK